MNSTHDKQTGYPWWSVNVICDGFSLPDQNLWWIEELTCYSGYFCICTCKLCVRVTKTYPNMQKWNYRRQKKWVCIWPRLTSAWPRLKTFSCSTQLINIKTGRINRYFRSNMPKSVIYPAHNVKMPSFPKLHVVLLVLIMCPH